MTLSRDISQQLPELTTGPVWTSFEKFRVEGPKSLEKVGQGRVATLQTKSGQYRVLGERDFQAILGLARDVERLRGGLRVVIKAARAVHQHPDDVSLDTLIEAVSLVGSLPTLPIRESFTPLTPEGLTLDEDDEVTMDPAQIQSPLEMKDSR
jgi:hypothetical protein